MTIFLQFYKALPISLSLLINSLMKRSVFYVCAVFTLVTVIMSFSRRPLVTVVKQALGDTILYPDEHHFKNLQQLTFGGDNAEAYFSSDSKYLIFQRTNPREGLYCDQEFVGKVPASGEKFEYTRVSSGKGRTTCGFFTKDGMHIIYASTYLGADTCPPVPDRKKYGNKYIWPIYASFDIFMADLDGKIVKRLTDTPGYDAEGTLSPDGTKMVFTSVRDGDLELYIMDLKTF